MWSFYTVLECVKIWKITELSEPLFSKWSVYDIPFKVQERPMDFNVIEHKKFINLVSDLTF